MSKQVLRIGINDDPGTASDLLLAGCLDTEYSRDTRRGYWAARRRGGSR